jgi:hypothetical protein
VATHHSTFCRIANMQMKYDYTDTGWLENRKMTNRRVVNGIIIFDESNRRKKYLPLVFDFSRLH